ncbi:Post-GPI attachment to proteins factor 3 [Mycena indigotica]|uniref:Post-GPI attachment to proteins factor 3 n=1 Tax=Mycena indigotica TaxID=2126181 RepID=A0A8H6VY76_9AGAR|nr:Post-GPI attachment to proteins factor 3 [Mycena indigotica]KAF7294588.1 Post-GPI attachment to proteins factor 3 [Mycena indigotica]
MKPQLILLAFAGVVCASSGDRSYEFKNCLTKCLDSRCSPSNTVTLSFPLRVTRWTCEDNCKYTCMHDITTRDKRLGDRVHQYYGKWPFWRLAGMQEPASVAFSLLNFWAHWRGLARVRRDVPNGHPMKSYYVLWAFTGLNAWIWSAVFHTRDWPITEKLDYFSAALTIFYALYYTVIRLFHLYPTARRNRLTLSTFNSSGDEGSALKAWSILCILVYIAHVSYLLFLPRFNYLYNILFNAVVGLTHNALWGLYAFPSSIPVFKRFPSRPKSYRPPFCDGVLELFDFAPFLRVIDAHSLWHLATAPIAAGWYTFLIQDAREDSWRSHIN